jgi:hypothetical protein
MVPKLCPAIRRGDSLFVKAVVLVAPIILVSAFAGLTSNTATGGPAGEHQGQAGGVAQSERMKNVTGGQHETWC